MCLGTGEVTGQEPVRADKAGGCSRGSGDALHMESVVVSGLDVHQG